MLCCVCKEKPATVHLTEIKGDKVQKLDLCEACAKAKGVNDLSFALQDLLPGPVTPQEIGLAAGGVHLTKYPAAVAVQDLIAACQKNLAACQKNPELSGWFLRFPPGAN